VKATEHGANLIKLTRGGWVNCYLVREDDGLTLVDTAVRRSGGKIIEAAEAAGAPIVRILVTHAHMDHVGSVDELAALLPDAEVIFPARDARFLRGDSSLDPDEPDAKPTFKQVKTRASREVVPGDEVESLQVVGAPGHSPGQVALLDVRDRTLIAADAFQTLGGTAVTHKPHWKFPLPGMATWHGPTAVESARKLRALEPSRLAVGHGKLLDDPLEEMDRAIAGATG
jgi:glyoxylase-like metal-dependent hydrolase (beta-lactamase superfamily II)